MNVDVCVCGEEEIEEIDVDVRKEMRCKNCGRSVLLYFPTTDDIVSLWNKNMKEIKNENR